MGGFVPNFTAPSGQGGSFATPPPLPNFPGGPSSGPVNSYLPFTGASYAGGGALPGQNKIQNQPTLDPTLTNALLGFMNTQIGQGLPGFNQSIYLPSTGQATTPGSLSAPLNPVLQTLMSFLTGQGGPGSLPGVLPEWQSEMSALQQPIEQNLADLKEQFGTQGALGSTELGTASQDYLAQTSADEMALLTQASQASLPNLLSSGEAIQGVDQAAIDRAYQQFMTDLPQNNPLLPYQEQLATTYPATYNKPGGVGSAILGSLGSLLGLIPGIGSAFSGMFGGGSGAAASMPVGSVGGL